MVVKKLYVNYLCHLPLSRKSLVKVLSEYIPEQLSETELLLVGEEMPRLAHGIEKVATPLASVVAEVTTLPPDLSLISSATPDAATESMPMLLSRMPDLSSS